MVICPHPNTLFPFMNDKSIVVQDTCHVVSFTQVAVGDGMHLCFYALKSNTARARSYYYSKSPTYLEEKKQQRKLSSTFLGNYLGFPGERGSPDVHVFSVRPDQLMSTV